MGDTPSVAEVLEKAADLLSKPGAWTQEVLARDAAGRMVLPEDEDAICFCGYGAVIRSAGITTSDPDHVAWRILDGLVPDRVFPDWNDADGRTQEEVVAKLREAAALARAEQVQA